METFCGSFLLAIGKKSGHNSRCAQHREVVIGPHARKRMDLQYKNGIDCNCIAVLFHLI